MVFRRQPASPFLKRKWLSSEVSDSAKVSKFGINLILNWLSDTSGESHFAAKWAAFSGRWKNFLSKHSHIIIIRFSELRWFQWCAGHLASKSVIMPAEWPFWWKYTQILAAVWRFGLRFFFLQLQLQTIIRISEARWFEWCTALPNLGLQFQVSEKAFFLPYQNCITTIRIS